MRQYSTTRVVSVSKDADHRFSKPAREEIVLLEGLGVEGDAHLGTTVQHQSRVAKDPTEPNLRQVHLIQSELFADLATEGFAVEPGQLGENITTSGLDLLALPRGTVLHLGTDAVVELTGLRSPCWQIDMLEKGLLKTVLGRDDDGEIVLRAGVMGIVVRGGTVKPGDAVTVDVPERPHTALERV